MLTYTLRVFDQTFLVTFEEIERAGVYWFDPEAVRSVITCTIASINDVSNGMAVCNPHEDYFFEKGRQVAFKRALQSHLLRRGLLVSQEAGLNCAEFDLPGFMEVDREFRVALYNEMNPEKVGAYTFSVLQTRSHIAAAMDLFQSKLIQLYRSLFGDDDEQQP